MQDLTSFIGAFMGMTPVDSVEPVDSPDPVPPASRCPHGVLLTHMTCLDCTP